MLSWLANEALAEVKTLAVFSKLVTLVLFEPLATTKEAEKEVKILAVDSRSVVRVDKLPLVEEKLAETIANEAETVGNVLEVVSKFVTLVDKDPLDNTKLLPVVSLFVTLVEKLAEADVKLDAVDSKLVTLVLSEPLASTYEAEKEVKVEAVAANSAIGIAKEALNDAVAAFNWASVANAASKEELKLSKSVTLVDKDALVVLNELVKV